MSHVIFAPITNLLDKYCINYPIQWIKEGLYNTFIISIQENDSNMIVDCIKIFVAYFEMWQKKNELKLIDWANYDFFLLEIRSIEEYV